MLPDYYEFFSPVKIISGNKALDNLPFELEQLGVRRPLIITDAGVINAGLIRYVKDAFAGSGMIIGAIFDDVPSDSSTDVVHRAVEIFRKNRCDSLVAVGGGSPMEPMLPPWPESLFQTLWWAWCIPLAMRQERCATWPTVWPCRFFFLSEWNII